MTSTVVGQDMSTDRIRVELYSTASSYTCLLPFNVRQQQHVLINYFHCISVVNEISFIDINQSIEIVRCHIEFLRRRLYDIDDVSTIRMITLLLVLSTVRTTNQIQRRISIERI
jgi:hypothetical protein